MKLLLPDAIESRMKRELRVAGRREIGGVLLGEFVGPAVFRVAEITVQRSGGTSSTFVRIPRLHAKAIKDFFDRTGHQYERFNYLGEWHSHPSYPTRPSGSDVRAMNEILENPSMAVGFAVLSIVKIPDAAGFEISSYVFAPNTAYSEITTIAAQSSRRKQDWRGVRRAPVVRMGTAR
jgi:[CysO sulfur-carrier protein]-S-L-cysteine hydrolase